MQGGFSFCGVDIAELGLDYAPNLSDTYIHNDGQYTVNEESFDSHNGGYFYGISLKPKSFTLRCYFQDEHINNGILSKISGFFSRGKTGRLVFQQREWLWYSATVINVDYSGLTNYMNGYITINMKAYYPYARCDSVSMPPVGTNEELEIVSNNSGLLSVTYTPTCNFSSVKAKKSLLLYNGGTEYADVAIQIAGDVGKGVEIRNLTTGQTCKIVALTKDVTSTWNKYLVCDSLNGKTILTGSTGSPELAFIYHDGGFINLAPSCPIVRGIKVRTNANTANVYALDQKFEASDVGRYIYIDGSWRKILSLGTNGSYVRIDSTASNTSTNIITNIVTMNEIEVVPITTMDLTKLDFVYKPTFK